MILVYQTVDIIYKREKSHSHDNAPRKQWCEVMLPYLVLHPMKSKQAKQKEDRNRSSNKWGKLRHVHIRIKIIIIVALILIEVRVLYLFYSCTVVFLLENYKAPLWSLKLGEKDIDYKHDVSYRFKYFIYFTKFLSIWRFFRRLLHPNTCINLRCKMKQWSIPTHCFKLELSLLGGKVSLLLIKYTLI